MRRRRRQWCTRWPRRRGCRGAEALEFSVGLMLLIGALVIGVRLVGAIRLQAQADEVARTLARHAVVCQRGGPSLPPLASVLPPGAVATFDLSQDPLVTVRVRFVPMPIVGVGAAASVSWTPEGTVTMRREPGC